MVTTTVIEKPGNGAGLSTMSADMISKLVLHGDLSTMSEQEKFNYVLYRCQAVGLDPATKPFDLLTLQGKQVLYATKACTDQISKRDGLSSTIVKEEEIKGVYKVTARISDASGRSTENVGCVTVDSLKGNDYCNAIMKAHTKAIRRATLAHCGLGMLDESELETIKDVPVTVKSEAVKEPLVVPVVEEKPAPPQAEADRPTRRVEKPEMRLVDEVAPKVDAQETASVLKVTSKNGVTKGKPWKLFSVLLGMADGSELWANTFDLDYGAVAEKLKGGKLANVRLKEVQYQGQTKHNLEFIEAQEG